MQVRVDGEVFRFRFRLPTPMRDSGDRMTSSCNFFQNLIAWLDILINPEDMSNAIDAMLKSEGGVFIYRNAKNQLCRAHLAFEGDDTLLRTSELLKADDVEAAFKSKGFVAKLKVVPSTAKETAITFVGYHALFDRGTIVGDNDGPVLCPEINRFFTQKCWSTLTAVDSDTSHAVHALYGLTMAHGFRHVEPVHAFCMAVYNYHNQYACKLKYTNQVRDQLSKQYLTSFGVMPTEEELRDFVRQARPETYTGASPALYKRLAIAAAGPATAAEWAMCTGLVSIDMHGKDLGTYVPKAWIA
jgi:hypothetical protein